MPSPSHPKGALCEETVEISQPSFTTSVGGYSSYLAHGIDPSSVSRAFEAQFHFSHAAGHRDQVALMFFLGQEGVHEFGSDYVAVSYVKGHVLGRTVYLSLCHLLPIPYSHEAHDVQDILRHQFIVGVTE